MSKGFWICVFYVIDGDALSLISGLFCTAMAVWSTANTVRIGIMDREDRRWSR